MLYIISVGGSLIYPQNGIDTKFIKSFCSFIEKEVKKGKRFILVTGGGQAARDYISAANKLDINKKDQDKLGIETTRLNALLLKSYFKTSSVYKDIIVDPSEKINLKKKIAISGGWKPGWSTDYVAVYLANTYKSKVVINLSNIDYVYDKDPKIKGAKKIKNLTWSDFRKIVGNKWTPGKNSPFDPIAARLAMKSQLKVYILNGKKINNLEKCLNNQKFIGSTIKD